MMSALNVKWGLVFHFLEMVRRKTMLFLETGKIKGPLEKPKILVVQPVCKECQILRFSKGASLVFTVIRIISHVSGYWCLHLLQLGSSNSEVT